MTMTLNGPGDHRNTLAYDGAIAVGLYDLCFHDANDVKPASSQADGGSEPLNKRAFAPKFAGVAAERKVTTDAAGTLDVHTVWEGWVTCPSQTWEVGDLVSADENGAGNALLNSQVDKTTNPWEAIGCCIERAASATTSVKVRLVSRHAATQPLPIKEVSGQHTTASASDTVITGLAVVTSVVAQLDDDPVDGCMHVTASLGDQAGTPAAGSILIKTWKSTDADASLVAATTTSKKVNWIAKGY